MHYRRFARLSEVICTGIRMPWSYGHALEVSLHRSSKRAASLERGRITRVWTLLHQSTNQSIVVEWNELENQDGGSEASGPRLNRKVVNQVIALLAMHK